MTNLPDLIARIEAATFGSEALDLEIDEAIGRIRFERIALGPYLYTQSRDDADSLTPPNFVRRISQIRFGMWHVQLWRGDKSFALKCDVESVAASEALARAAAALKARVKQE